MTAARDVLATAATVTAGWRAVPDYLLVGGKRCGTTSLQAWLAAHPAVVPPHSGKGTHYFDENYAKGDRWFRAHYPLRAALTTRARLGHHPVVTGEASPYYAFHPAALDRVAERLPDVRLVFVARDPVERAWSHWRYEQRRGFEPLDIHAALDAEPERLAGEEDRMLADPAYVSWPHRHFSYVARGQYAGQLERCLKAVGPDRLLVLEFGAMLGDHATLDRVSTFLGIEPSAHPLPQRESGGASDSAPADVRARLEAVFAESNRWLREELDVDLG